MKWRRVAWVCLAFGALAAARAAEPSAAARFGAREGIAGMSLSPGGTRLAFVAPLQGQASALYTVDLAGTRQPRQALVASGRPERLTNCGWVSDSRLLCTVYVISTVNGVTLDFTRMIAVDADGGNVKIVSKTGNDRSLGFAQSGGRVIDWLPEASGEVLVARVYVPESTLGTHVASTKDGYAVDRVDTATLRAHPVEAAKPVAGEYISDGHGTVRIMGTRRTGGTGYDTGIVSYYYRAKESREWKPLGRLDTATDAGFNPYAVDRDCDCVYGFAKRDGRLALVRMALDGSGRQEIVLARPDVDVDGLVRIGRARRVVGASFATERRETVFFDPELRKLAAGLSKALPGLPLIRFVDASLDEGRLLLWAGSDVDPGRYYVYDKATRRLDETMISRAELDGVPLAPVKAVSYPAADGTMIPGYLTLPPGAAGRRGPAIVMPHGGPGARDTWGFDWLAQYYANRGYAVLQPNFRGSTGYGDAWFRDNGFRSWRLAIGDVADAGRWLVSSGVADPGKLAVVGWSYGGYAALQAGATEPALFKAIVAVAPVTDLARLKADRYEWADYKLVSTFVGDGPHVRAGSPAQNAAAIAAPVLLFHGDQDLNVAISQSRLMAGRLKDAGRPAELVVFPGLDHQLDDTAARTALLERSDAFLRKAMGM